MEGYKIVCIDGNEDYCSFISVVGKTIYKIGEFANRRDGYGPLAVFDTLDNARRFLYEFHLGGKPVIHKIHHRLFKVEYTRSEDKELWVVQWNGKIEKPGIPLPIGTDFADSVKLLEEVEV